MEGCETRWEGGGRTHKHIYKTSIHFNAIESGENEIT